MYRYVQHTHLHTPDTHRTLHKHVHAKYIHTRIRLAHTHRVQCTRQARGSNTRRHGHMLVVFLHPSAGPLGPRYPRQCVFQLRLHAASSSPLASAQQAATGWHYSGLAPGSGPSGIGFSLIVRSWEGALNRSCFLTAAWGRCGGGTLIFELRVQRRKVMTLFTFSPIQASLAEGGMS